MAVQSYLDKKQTLLFVLRESDEAAQEFYTSIPLTTFTRVRLHHSQKSSTHAPCSRLIDILYNIIAEAITHLESEKFHEMSLR